MRLHARPPSKAARVVPTCEVLEDPVKHQLLAHLTLKANPRRNTSPRVRGDVEDWAAALGLLRQDVVSAKEFLLEFGYVKEADGRMVLPFPCSCVKTELSRKAPGKKPGGKQVKTGLPSTGERQYDSARPSGASGSCSRESVTPEQFDPGAASSQVTATPREVANIFHDRVMRAAYREGLTLLPGTIARGLIAKHVSVMYSGENGLSTETVLDMIDAFCRQYRRYHKPGVDPGKVFAAHRRGLYVEQQRRSRLVKERDMKKLAENGRRYTSIQEIRGA